MRSKVGSDPVIPVFAVVCVFNERGQVLLQQRGDRNGWGFPDGAVELGESAAAAAIREVMEETGVAIAVEELFRVYSDYHDRYPNGDEAQTIVIAFLSRPFSSGIVADGVETLHAAYVPLAEPPPM